MTTDPKDASKARREAEAAEADQKQGHGTVPNVTPEQAGGEKGELKKALHDLEEEKGDWGKDH